MTWFRVDDGLAFHAKTLQAGNAAMGMWVRAGAWCSHHLTDGHIPTHVVATLGTTAQAKALVTAALWIEEEGGYCFHDWKQSNPLRVEVQEEREAAKERMRRAREAKRSGSVRANNGGTSPAVAVTPTRPDPTLEEKAAATPLPAPTRSDVEGLCRYFLEAISRNGVKATITEKWRTEARLLLDADKRDREELRAVIDWCTQDEFWKPNVLSVPKLRVKYDQLRLAMQRAQPRPLSADPHQEHLEQWR